MKDEMYVMIAIALILGFILNGLFGSNLVEGKKAVTPTTCASYNTPCPDGGTKKGGNTTCAKNPCKATECCNAAPKQKPTCASYNTACTGGGTKKAPSTQCATNQCTAAECCTPKSPPTTCASYTTPCPGGGTKKGGNTTCAKNPCKPGECCNAAPKQKPTCASYKTACTGGGTKKAPSTQCADDTCTASECCTPKSPPPPSIRPCTFDGNNQQIGNTDVTCSCDGSLPGYKAKICKHPGTGVGRDGLQCNNLEGRMKNKCPGI